jgi:hypothetical protein
VTVTTTYPNGQQLVSDALTVDQINGILQALTLGMLGETSILAAVPHAGAAGLDYKNGDLVGVAEPGSTNGLLVVTGIGAGGLVASLAPVAPNKSSGFALAVGLAATGGSGTGLQVDVTSVGPSPTTDRVRVSWPREGAPFQNAADDICYLRCVPVDDPYDKIRDEIMLAGPGDLDTERWSYTRAWTIHWTLYGPNSFDRARAIKDALFLDYFCDQLTIDGLFPVSDYPAPVRAPEEINGRWWERVDYQATVYEFCTATIEDQTVQSVEVIGKDNVGDIFDIVVGGSGPPHPDAPTVTLAASPATIQQGQSLTLTWTSLNATSLDLQPGVGAVSGRGSTVVTPSETTTYMVTATGPGGESSASVKVTVNVPPPIPTPEVVQLKADGTLFGSVRFTMDAPYMPGNLLLAFAASDNPLPTPSDGAANDWVLLYSQRGFGIWYAIANGYARRDEVTFDNQGYVYTHMDARVVEVSWDSRLGAPAIPAVASGESATPSVTNGSVTASLTMSSSPFVMALLALGDPLALYIAFMHVSEGSNWKPFELEPGWSLLGADQAWSVAFTETL